MNQNFHEIQSSELRLAHQQKQLAQIFHAKTARQEGALHRAQNFQSKCATKLSF